MSDLANLLFGDRARTISRFGKKKSPYPTGKTPTSPHNVGSISPPVPIVPSVHGTPTSPLSPTSGGVRRGGFIPDIGASPSPNSHSRSGTPLSRFASASATNLCARSTGPPPSLPPIPTNLFSASGDFTAMVASASTSSVPALASYDYNAGRRPSLPNLTPSSSTSSLDSEQPPRTPANERPSQSAAGGSSATVPPTGTASFTKRPMGSTTSDYGRRPSLPTFRDHRDATSSEPAHSKLQALDSSSSLSDIAASSGTSKQQGKDNGPPAPISRSTPTAPSVSQSVSAKESVESLSNLQQVPPLQRSKGAGETTAEKASSADAAASRPTTPAKVSGASGNLPPAYSGYDERRPSLPDLSRTRTNGSESSVSMTSKSPKPSSRTADGKATALPLAFPLPPTHIPSLPNAPSAQRPSTTGSIGSHAESDARTSSHRTAPSSRSPPPYEAVARPSSSRSWKGPDVPLPPLPPPPSSTLSSRRPSAPADMMAGSRSSGRPAASAAPLESFLPSFDDMEDQEQVRLPRNNDPMIRPSSTHATAGRQRSKSATRHHHHPSHGPRSAPVH